MSATELDATFHDLVKRLAYIQARKNELEAEESEIKTTLTDNVALGTYSINGRPALSVTVGHRFDPVLAAQVLPTELVTLCEATVIDAKRAKQALPPVLFAQCQKLNNRPTVKLT